MILEVQEHVVDLVMFNIRFKVLIFINVKYSLIINKIFFLT